MRYYYSWFSPILKAFTLFYSLLRCCTLISFVFHFPHNFLASILNSHINQPFYTHICNHSYDVFSELQFCSPDHLTPAVTDPTSRYDWPLEVKKIRRAYVKYIQNKGSCSDAPLKTSSRQGKRPTEMLNFNELLQALRHYEAILRVPVDPRLLGKFTD